MTCSFTCAAVLLLLLLLLLFGAWVETKSAATETPSAVAMRAGVDVSVSYHELDIGGKSCEAGETNRGDDGSRLLGESRFAPGTKYPMTLVVTLSHCHRILSQLETYQKSASLLCMSCFPHTHTDNYSTLLTNHLTIQALITWLQT